MDAISNFTEINGSTKHQILEIPILSDNEMSSYRIPLAKLLPNIYILPNIQSYFQLYKALETFFVKNNDLSNLDYKHYIRKHFILDKQSSVISQEKKNKEDKDSKLIEDYFVKMPTTIDKEFFTEINLKG